MGLRIAFLVNGLGLGNSTRCHAIIQQLHSLGCEVDVYTSGNGLWYFRDRPEIARLEAIESIYYASKNGSLSVAGTLGAAGHLLGIHRRNDRRLAALFDERRPHVVVADSIYNFRPVRRLGVPLVALNNSDVTYHSFWSFPDKPRSIYAQFFAVEMMDYLFQRLVPDLVISPVLDPRITESGRPFLRVPPIVRNGVDSAIRTQPAARAVIMLSGSIFGMPARLTHSHYPVRIDVIGRDVPHGTTAPDGVVFHGKMANPLPLLKEADVAVVNGGFSAVSEMYCLRKPMVVLPVAGHAEQWVNGRTIEALGLGRLATEATWEDVMLELLGDLERFRAAASAIAPSTAGAARAADAIVDLATRHA